MLLDKLPEVLSREQKLIQNSGNRRFSKWVLLKGPSVKQ
jgi:hypothetical protein